ncbi:4'-phosphopantetheinyl transferase family protein [Arthrobacter cryoconiti]|uniref:4'-phosphopantetheinyl transferase family protein n=1 Tax=Arthrobacter cryoconiti TaxID=748907 RepID=A0ABV8R3M3_9MICC|nr:4'-phosphopantetheinyl transferase superfamily protein [Arthrobacter cryoconiti]MCC9067275.1 4'-phosphopantetheinyl transferase superfamily protein [Arthrobacter cryoconiti]
MNESFSNDAQRVLPTVRAFDLATMDGVPAESLDGAEQARAAGMMDAKSREHFIAGRVAQRIMAAELLHAKPQELLAAYLCPDCGPQPRSSHGRPGYLLHGVPAALSISFSRSHGWALAAMVPTAGLRIGIDLEHRAAVGFAGFDDVALSAAEKLSVLRLAPDAQDAWRVAVWARKEALAKHSGLGLRTDPREIPAYPEPAKGVELWDLDREVLGLPAGFAAALAF